MRIIVALTFAAFSAVVAQAALASSSLHVSDTPKIESTSTTSSEQVERAATATGSTATFIPVASAAIQAPAAPQMALDGFEDR
jgi:protein tyrosine phosphatase (PTP) superfamily phosphohydrolase (DUF442 family)